MALPAPVAPNLSFTDNLVLGVLLRPRLEQHDATDEKWGISVDVSPCDGSSSSSSTEDDLDDGTPCEIEQRLSQDDRCTEVLEYLGASNDSTSKVFQPTVSTNFDITLPRVLQRYHTAYVAWARTVVRVETDVVFVTHLLFYLTVSLPSALLLFYHFTWLHGILHVAMQFWSLGAYHSLVHVHNHSHGILHKRYAWIDRLYPYITDPLFGHTWHSFYYHHIKHHHVEDNGPEDLTSTLRYQRDDCWHFILYNFKFLFTTWYRLPLYFIGKKRPGLAVRFFFFEAATYAMMGTCAYLSFRAAFFALILPHCILRPVLMIGNWGQHAFVDEDEPDSDYKSSVTTLDVLNNKLSFNEGYHTSHHLNPKRHWRDHPAALLRHKDIYAKKGALIFQGIDYLLLSYKLIRKDYTYIARHLVPVGEQIGMSISELEQYLKSKTKAFTEAEIQKHYPTKKYT